MPRYSQYFASPTVDKLISNATSLSAKVGPVLDKSKTKSFNRCLLFSASCGTPICKGDKTISIKGDISKEQNVVGEEGVLLAGTSVFVLDPGETPSKFGLRLRMNSFCCQIMSSKTKLAVLSRTYPEIR